MISPIRAFRKFACGLAALFALTGCAVMTIDVDVYKGPLANHEAVQEHQFALLAVSAKPLLVQLRDTLECEERFGKPNCKPDQFGGWYEPDWIPPTFETGSRSDRFENLSAQQVNNLLYLYKDEESGIFTNFVKSVGKEIEKFRNGKSVLSLEPKADEADWTKYAISINQFTPLFEKKVASKGDSSNGLRACLIELYKGLIAPSLRTSRKGNTSNRRDAKPRGIWLPEPCKYYGTRLSNGGRVVSIPGIAASLYKELKKQNSAERLTYLKISATTAPPSPQGVGDSLRSDEVFSLLLKKTHIRDHARMLFGPNVEKETFDGFVDEVVNTARAYGDVRQSAESILVAAIDALLQIQSADADEEKIVKATRRLSTLIAELIELKRLILTVYSENSLELLRNNLEASVNGGVGKPVLANRSSFRKIRKALTSLIEEKPVAIAKQLRKAHTALKVVSNEDYKERYDEGLKESHRDSSQNLAQRYTVAISRKEGIARDVSAQPDVADDILTIYAETASDAGGIEAGRPAAGLDRLTKEYEHEIINGDKSETIDQLRVKLERALVHFAQKLVFIADHQFLFDKPANAGNGSLDLREQIVPFVTALQAFGNAIIVNADHVFRRNDHRKQDEAAGPAERAAWAQALGRTKSVVFDDLIALLDEAVEQAEAAVTKAKNAESAATKRKEYVEEALDAAKRGSRDRTSVPGNDLDSAFKGEIDAAARLLDALAVLKTNETEESGIVTFLGDDPLTKAAAKAGTVKWVERKLGTFGVAGAKDTKRLILVNTKSYLENEAPDFANDTMPAAASPQFKAVVKAIEDNERPNAELTLNQALAAQQEAITKAQQKVVKTETARDTKKREQKVLADIRSDVLQAADKQLIREGDPESFIAAIVKALEKIRNEAESGSDTENAAIAVIKTIKEQKHRVAQLAIPKRLASGRPSRAAVLDQFISLVKFGESLATAQGNEKRARDFRKALEKAETQKADITFIRPAAAYLRSSFAATGLQDNTSFKWRNELVRHAFRSFPLIGQAATNFQESKRLDVLDQVDKQFWQNINRVRVAAAGDTNYAIAKDDIGNWYVKSYSADTKDIIESAKNLALFNVGASLGNVDLLNQAQQQAGTGGAPGTAAPAADTDVTRSRLARVFDKHTEAYEASVNLHFDNLVALLSEKGLTKKISNAWTTDVETKDFAATLTPKLEAAFASIADERTAFAKKTGEGGDLAIPDLAAKVPGGVRLAIRFYRAAVDDIDGSLTTPKQGPLDSAKEDVASKESALKTEQDKLNAMNAQTPKPDTTAQVALVEQKNNDLKAAQDKQASAQNDLNKAKRAEVVAKSKAATQTREALDDFLTKRIGSVDNYKSAITFIGDAAGPNPPANSQ